MNWNSRFLLSLRTPDQQTEPLKNWTSQGTYAIDIDMFACLQGDRFWIAELKKSRQHGNMSVKFLMTSPNQVIRYPRAQFVAIQDLIKKLREAGASVRCPLYIRDNIWMSEPDVFHLLEADLSELDLSNVCEPEFPEESTTYVELPKTAFKFLTYEMQQQDYADWWELNA